MSNGIGQQVSVRAGTLAASLIIGLSLIVCALIVGGTIKTVKGYNRTISVTGAANKPITSDYAVWDGTISASALTLDDAYRTVKSGLEKTRAFLAREDMSEGEYSVGTVQIYKNYNREGDLTGYNLRQTVTVEIDNVERVTDLAKMSSELIEQGVEFESGRPRYLFTKLDSLKIEMIRAATENAKLRAQELANTTGTKVGAPVSASVGVFQIRPLHSQEVSSMGISDVFSIEKEIVSTVHISFLVE